MSERFNDFKSKLDERFKKEFEEIKKNKIRIAGLAFCVISFGLFALSEKNSGGEEIILNSPPEQVQPVEMKQKPDNKPEVTPAKKNSPEKIGENVTPVTGANSGELQIKNPFARPKEIKKPEKYAGKEAFFGSVTDCYQPCEAKYKRTRSLLEQLQGSGISISIATKSDLVLRDLDLIRTFPNARVSFQT